MPHSLRLIEDRLSAGGSLDLPPVNRVLYVLEGRGRLGEGRETGPGEAWHGAGPCHVEAAAPTRLLRFELVRQPPPPAHGGRVRLEHPLALDSRHRYLMRCDRVEFEPGGVALPHRHRGGGIRYLLEGALGVTVGEGWSREMRPGDPWFESGREPVLAVAAPGTRTSFLRVSILPAEALGKSSIVYVNPADAARGRPRRYAVHVDEPIRL